MKSAIQVFVIIIIIIINNNIIIKGKKILKTGSCSASWPVMPLQTCEGE